jgi:hypothetical protein
VQQLGAGGFNTMAGQANNDSNYGAFLDTAAAQNVKVLTIFTTGSYEDVSLVNTYKTKPAVLGWNVGDDADLDFTVADLQTQHQRVKAADPNHISSLSMTASARIGRYGNDEYTKITDAPQMQMYPIFDGSSPDMNVGEAFNVWERFVRSSEKANRVPIADVQTFNWERSGTADRWPTADEVDVMSYLALAAGTKGLLYYTFEDYSSTGGGSTINLTHPDI